MCRITEACHALASLLFTLSAPMSLEIGLTIGAMELGLLIASVLYGVMTVQIYIYSKSSTHDPLFIHALVRQKRYLSSTLASSAKLHKQYIAM